MKPLKAWREAATLIIAAKSKDVSSGCNYKILCMKRSEKTSFMPNNVVFPGGMIEKQDETLEWLKYFKKNGLEKKLEEFRITTDRPLILQDQENQLQRCISLRITAIRESFEELGVLICKPLRQTSTKGYFRGVDIERYQKLIHNKKLTFLDMCLEFDIIPDLWRLKEWDNWLTPTFYSKRRFDTIFFITTLDEQPPVHPESIEAYSYMVRV